MNNNETYYLVNQHERKNFEEHFSHVDFDSKKEIVLIDFKIILRKIKFEKLVDDTN